MKLPDPPQEPTLENPGAFLQGLVDFAEELEKATGKEPSSKELVLTLAHMIDLRNWGREMATWKQMKEVGEFTGRFPREQEKP